jgi:RNA polymerase sigma-70 factor (ECF subfamily)
MRALRDHYTREKRRRFGESSALEHQTRLSGLAADREEHRLLLRALTELETETQIVLSLFYWENMSARELADMYSITHSAMRSRIARARDDLKAQLQTISVPVHVRASLMGDLEGWARSVVAQGGSRRSMPT